MAELKINIAELRNNKKSIEDKITQLEDLNTRLETLITRIESSWSGDASTAYINKMRGYLAQAKKTIKVYEEFKTYTQRAADDFENADNECANTINGSF